MIDKNLIDFVFNDFDDFFSDYFTKLNDAFFFEPQKLSLDTSPIGKLTDEIFKELNLVQRNKQKEKKIFLNCLLTNLAISYRRRLPIAFPIGSNYFKIDKTYGLNHYTYSIAIQIIKAFGNYIEIKNGFYNRVKNRGKFTRIQPSEKLKKIFSLITLDDFEPVYINDHTIFLKDPLSAKKKEFARPIILKAVKSHNNETKAKKKKKEYPIYYRLNSKISNKIKFLNRYNQFIEGAEIIFPIDESFVLRLKDEDLKQKTLFFIDKLKNLLHSIPLINPSYKDLKQIYNLIMTIQQTAHTYISNPLLIKNNDKYLLFSKLNGKIHSIYHRGSFKKGGRFYGGGYQSLNEEQRSKILINSEKVIELDYGGLHLRMLYHLEGLEYLNDPYDVFNGNSELRELMKIVSLICINARSEGIARNGIRQLFFENPFLKAIYDKYNLDERELIKAFKDFHSQIVKYFFSDQGVYLMYLDSLIAEDIIKHFLNKNIPCLTIHDSFIVCEKYKDELYKVMNDVYYKHLNFYPVIK